MTEQDTSDLIPADILYHSLDTGIEDNDLAVLGMVDTIDIGDTITYPADRTDLMLLCLEMEIFDLTLQDRDDSLLASSLSYLGKLVCELLHTSVGTPVIDLITGTDDETAAKRRIFFGLKDHILSVVFLLNKITDILQLLIGGCCHIGQCHNELFLFLGRDFSVCGADIIPQIDISVVTQDFQEISDL